MRLRKLLRSTRLRKPMNPERFIRLLLKVTYMVTIARASPLVSDVRATCKWGKDLSESSLCALTPFGGGFVGNAAVFDSLCSCK